MEHNQILSEVQDIFRVVLDNGDIVINDSTTADDIEEWDSLSHIQLIVAIEKKYNIKFTAREIMEWNNVGEFVKCIKNKINL